MKDMLDLMVVAFVWHFRSAKVLAMASKEVLMTYFEGK